MNKFKLETKLLELNLRLWYVGSLLWFKNLPKLIKIWRCKQNKHIGGAHLVIEKVPNGEWEPPRGNCSISIRPTAMKLKCEKCSTIFLINTWDFKWVNEKEEY